MNELQVFNNPEFGEIRTVEVNGEPWLVGKDVAVALGYKNPQEAIRTHVEEEDKGVSEILTPGGKQTVPIINESGLYSLVLSSKLPGAKKFKRWVTAEVLPSIRKHGLYATENTVEAMLNDPDTAIRLLQEVKDERAKRKALEAEVEANRPKALFADSVAASKSSILVGELAKLLKQNGVDIGQNRLFERLRREGYLIRRNGNDYNMPTQKSMELGLFEIKETVVTHADGHTSINKTPKVTGKGQLFFVDKFLGD